MAGMVAGSLVAVLGAAGVLNFPYWEYIYVSGAIVSALVMVAVSVLTKVEEIDEELEAAFG